MGFAGAIRTCLSKYVTFSGRARRSEYWWFVLFVAVGTLVLGLVDAALFGRGTPLNPPTRIFAPVFQLATLLPLLAAGWRRMHDSGRPGWYLLIPLGVFVVSSLVVAGGVVGFGLLGGAGMGTGAAGMAGGVAAMVFVGLIWLVELALLVLTIWWLVQPTQPGENAYGPEPPA